MLNLLYALSLKIRITNRKNLIDKENIRVNFKVKTDEENLDRLKALSKLSPVFDVVSNGTDVAISVERK